MGKEPRIYKKIKAHSFDEVMEESMKKREKARKFVEKTGKCFVCKKNLVVLNGLKCPKCLGETENILKELHGTGGFMAFNIKPPLTKEKK